MNFSGAGRKRTGGGFGKKSGGPKKSTEWSYKKPGSRGGERSDRSDRAATMFDAVCSQCGNECQVPFKPNGRKPVLCNNCFGKQENTASSRPAPRSFGSRTTDNTKEQLEQINIKLSKILRMLEERD